MICTDCGAAVELRELPLGLGHTGRVLVNPEDDTPHRLTCAAADRKRPAGRTVTDHYDECPRCGRCLCQVSYDRLGAVHSCLACRRRRWVPGQIVRGRVVDGETGEILNPASQQERLA